MDNSGKCKFKNKGKTCMRPSNDGRCKIHKIINTECPICLECEDNEWFTLSCNHRAHTECLKGMVKLECPLCRSNITNLPNQIEQTIKKQSEEYKIEQEEEERNEIIQMMSEFESSPQIPILLALSYLNQLGVPSNIIPQNIDITLDPESPIPPFSYIFADIVSNVIEYMQTRIAEPEISENDSSFENQDMMHSIRTRTSENSDENTIIFNISNLPPFVLEDF